MTVRADSSKRKRLGVGSVLVLAAFSLVVVRPVSNNGVLIPIFLFLGFAGATAFLGRHRRASKTGAQLLAVTLWLGVTFCVLGLLFSNPGALYGLVPVGGVVVWWLLAEAANEREVSTLFRLLPFLALYVSLSLVQDALVGSGFLAGGFPVIGGVFRLIAQNSAVNAQQGVIATRDYYGIASLVGLIPLIAATFMVPGRPGLFGPRWIRLAALAASVIAALVSGRRAAILLCAIGPILAFVLVTIVQRRQGTRGKSRSAPAARLILVLLVVLGVVIAAASSIGLSLSQYSSYITLTTASGNSGEAQVRTEQVKQLAKASLEKPWGAGLGAVINGYRRNDQRPWEFEMQYSLLIFQLGLLGFGVLAAVWALYLWRALRAVYDSDLFPLAIAALVGALGMIIANASNPYLQAPGLIWTVLIPLAVYETQRRRRAPVLATSAD